MEARFNGLEELLKKWTPELYSGPLRKFLTRFVTLAQKEARTLAPHSDGFLDNSIAIEVDPSNPPLWAKMGSNLFYAPYQEFGTGSQGDPDVPHKASHWPKGADLDVWASRHGFESGRQVARIIGLRGGLRPKRFMRGGIEKAFEQVDDLLAKMAAEIKAKWES